MHAFIFLPALSWALSHVMICRPPLLPSSEVAIHAWKMRTVLNRMKYHISDLYDFYFLSYGWLYLQFTVTQQVCHRPKIEVVQKWPNLQERIVLPGQWFFSSRVLFVQLLVFEIWSILYIVEFDVCKIMYAKTTMYTRSTISQQLKVHKKKSWTKK